MLKIKDKEKILKKVEKNNGSLKRETMEARGQWENIHSAQIKILSKETPIYSKVIVKKIICC